MDLEGLQQSIGIPLASFIACFVSGFFPLVNAELYLIAISALVSDRFQLAWIVVLAALGQMLSKTLIFFSATGAMKLIPKRKLSQKKLDDLTERMHSMEGRVNFLIFISAFLGIPPFLIVSVVAGLVKVSPLPFVIFGFAGRFLRFLIIAIFPQVLKGLAIWN